MLDDCLNPWLVEIENECFQKLLTEEQKQNESHGVEFDRDAFLQADVKTTHEVLAADIQNGILSRNEARAVLNLNAYAGGDEFLVPMNMVEAQTEPVARSTCRPRPPEKTRDDARIAELRGLFARRLVKRLNHERTKPAPRYVPIRDAFHEELGVLMNSRQAAYERLAAFILDYEALADEDAAALAADATLGDYFDTERKNHAA